MPKVSAHIYKFKDIVKIQIKLTPRKEILKVYFLYLNSIGFVNVMMKGEHNIHLASAAFPPMF